MTDLLRVGVIGAGIGAGYIAGFQKQPRVEVTAVCARTPTRLLPVAQKYGIPRTYIDYELMMAQEPLDIVVVASPNYLHHPMTMAALEAGRHVLCDKPLALDVTQASEMAERAEKLGRKHFVPFTFRFFPAALYMKEIIASGFVGRPYHVNVRFYVSGWGDPQGPMRWQFEKEQAGSGVLSNLGSHVVHLVQWWLGDLRHVCAMTTTAVKERALADGSGRVPAQLDDTCALLAKLEDGSPVVFDISSVALVQRVNLEIGIFGSDGTLTFQNNWGEEDALTGRILAQRKNDPAPSLVPIPARLIGEFLDMPDFYTPMRTCFTRMAAEFVNAIREDRPAEPNFHDGVRVQELLDAAVKSAAEKCWVTLIHQSSSTGASSKS
jgi:predicted dehydrogenase